MSDRLREATERLRQTNASLESQVAERTQALRSANTQLQTLIEELKTLDQLKSNFMSIMSHELLTPINFIVGFGSALEDELMGPLNEQQLETVGKMLAGAERLTRMVRNTLEYTQLEAGKLSILPEAIDYRDLVERFTGRVEPMLAERKQTLTMNLPDEIPAIWADPDRVEQVLYEVIDNASKFSPEGAGVRLTVVVVDDLVSTEVADTGAGIPEEALPKLFLPFFQADFTSTRHHGGMGLGLAIAYNLIVKLGGSMVVESVPEQGTRVRFQLPVARESVTATQSGQLNRDV
jgi:two-component system sensor histidine kinase ChiS